MLGIILLSKAKPPPENQRLILINLSIIEILYAFWYIPTLYNEPEQLAWKLTDDFLWVLIHTVFQLLILTIITDKFAGVYLNLKYQVVCTNQRIRCLLVSFWIFGATFASLIILMELFLFPREQVQNYYEFSYLSFDVFIAVNLILQFIYLFRKVQQIRRQYTTVHILNMHIQTRPVPKFMIPTVIVGTYVLCCLSSSIIWTMISLKEEHSEVEEHLMYFAAFLEATAIISDALTYILLQKRIRVYLKHIFIPKKIIPVTGLT